MAPFARVELALTAMKKAMIASAVAVAATLAAAQPNPYRTVADWLAPQAASLGSVSAVFPASNGDIWIAERCGANSCEDRADVAPIRVFEASGRPGDSIGAGLFAWPHGLHVDADGFVWVTDGRAAEGKGHQVVKLTAAGQVVLRLGEAGVAGDGRGRFNGPTAVWVAPDGAIFVADGHEPESNNRIVKFAPDGRFVKSWGGSGSGPGEFRVPHALAMDSAGRLFVADRDNNRIQIFDSDGNFIDEWTQFGRPSGLFIDAEDRLYVSDNQSNAERNPGWQRGIRVGSARDGTLAAFIPDPEFDPANAEETGAHGIAADAAGNIYGAEVWSQTVKKYVRE